MGLEKCPLGTSKNFPWEVLEGQVELFVFSKVNIDFTA